MQLIICVAEGVGNVWEKKTLLFSFCFVYGKQCERSAAHVAHILSPFSLYLISLLEDKFTVWAVRC